MNHVMADIESCLAAGGGKDEASIPFLVSRLRHEDWRVRYAAAIALGERRSVAAVPDLVALLGEEDEAPLYSQKEELAGLPAGCNRTPQGRVPAGVPPDTAEAWRRRGRVKQAVCLALGLIGAAAAPAALPALHRYATDQAEDYPVRAASCKALAQIADPSSLAVLTEATKDPEWCTATEARKGAQSLAGPQP